MSLNMLGGKKTRVNFGAWIGVNLLHDKSRPKQQNPRHNSLIQHRPRKPEEWGSGPPGPPGAPAWFGWTFVTSKSYGAKVHTHTYIYIETMVMCEVRG